MLVWTSSRPATLRKGLQTAKPEDTMEPVAPQPPPPGTWIRNWRLERLIHVGKNACVYRAVAGNGTVGALKALRPSAIAHRPAAERFAREISVLQGLTHPAVPRLLDQGIDEDSLPWFVTEWLVGWDLETHRARLGGSLPSHEVMDVGLRVLDALGHAHGAGFIHRDVKPANLFLTETGELKVLDFGLCRGLAAATDFGITGNVVIGTPAFMAPEQAARQWGQVDPRADLWAVGATLFMLASGRPVHEGDSEEQRRASYRSDARSLALVAPHFPAGLVAVVDRALLRDIKQRWQSAEQMREALAEALQREEPGAPVLPRTGASPDAHRHTTEQDREVGAVSRRFATTSLRIVNGPDFTKTPVRTLSTTDELLLGRDVGNTGWSVNDSRVSRVHMRIAWDERQGCYRATDLQSTNGSRVNGMKRSTLPLSTGDVVRIGDTVLVVTESNTTFPFLALAEQASRSLATLLLSGETGVGKEVLARQIHAWSGRPGAFVPVNCGALPRDLAASELFGHAKGAFSGAGAARRGVFSAAQGGTLLLDEVGELPLEMQPLLLRALQERAIRPVGSDYEQPVDVRVVAATNVRLEVAVAEGRFRPDLYARLAQIPIAIPPLRQRREQILELAATFAGQAGQRLLVTAEAAEALLLWGWPFNVRELENLIRRFCAMGDPGRTLDMEFLRGANPALAQPFEDRASTPPASGGSGMHTVRNPLSDRAALEAMLSECEGNVSEAARRLNTTRAQVYRWMERFGIEVSRNRSDSQRK